MAALLAVPVDRIGSRAVDVRVLKSLLSGLVWLIAATLWSLGWMVGATVFAVRWCAAGVAVGFTDGIAVRGVSS